MTRNLASAALACALLAFPLAARADVGISLSGRAGGSYLLSSSWQAGASGSSSLFGLTAGLGISGGYFNPRFLRWSLDGDYDWTRGALFHATNDFDRFGFRASTLFLGGTSLPISLTASRSYIDSVAQGIGATIGNSITTTYGGTVNFQRERLPSASLGLSRQTTETERVGDTPTSASSTRLTLGVSQALSRFEYSAAYDTSWNTGTFSELNYRSHTLLINTSAPLSDEVRFNLFDHYFLRLPTADAVTNPRYDTNALGAGLQWRHGTRLNSGFSYAYAHDLVEAPSLPLAERDAHVLAANTRYQLREGLYLLGGAGFTAAQSRLGALHTDGLGQTLRAGAEWVGKYRWGSALVSGTASGGVVEPDGAPVRGLYGIAAAGSFNRAWGRLAATGQYAASFDSGNAVVDGSTFTQQLRAECSWRADERSKLRALLSGNSGRRDDRLMGVSLNRALSLLIEYSGSRFTGQLGGGLTDGLAQALTNPISDGLFLPAAFNTHSAYATLGGSASFDRGRLSFGLNARLGEISAPGRPPSVEEGFQLVAVYTLGRFRFSAEERFAVGGLSDARQTTNLFMLRVTRSFDWSF